jgi:hypothetical protein
MAALMTGIIKDGENNLFGFSVFRMQHAIGIPGEMGVWDKEESGIGNPDNYCYRVKLSNLTHSYFFDLDLAFACGITERPVAPKTVLPTDSNLPSFIELCPSVDAGSPDPSVGPMSLPVVSFKSLKPGGSAAAMFTVLVHNMPSPSKFYVQMCRCTFTRAELVSPSVFKMQQPKTVSLFNVKLEEETAD